MASLQSSVQLALVVGRASWLRLAIHSAVVAALIFVTLVGLHSVKDVMALQAEWTDDGVMANSDRRGVGVVCAARASPSATLFSPRLFSRSSEWVEAGVGGATLHVWWRGPARMLYVTIRYAAVCVFDGADPPPLGNGGQPRLLHVVPVHLRPDRHGLDTDRVRYRALRGRRLALARGESAGRSRE